MEKIASFRVDHTKLKEGMYISQVNGDIVTYDIRMTIPNGGLYIPCDAIHTIEHLMAVYIRNSEYKEDIIYVGPMGCRTGFYFLTRNVSHEAAIGLVKASMNFIKDYEGKIPGRSYLECGNFVEHSLAGAKVFAAKMAEIIKDWTPEMLQYNG